jgi:GNAT superfamily N-acetyltransferase
MPSFSDPRLVCRPSLPSDTADVLAFTRRIWEGRDYIHLVWDEWLADPRGLLVSAQFGPRVVGIAKITPVFPGQWWLHGLRVDPDYQGRKIASHLHEYTDNWWLDHGDGTIRLLTSTKRVQVHHLCERTGYRRVGEIITYRRRVDGGVKPDPIPSDAGQAGSFDALEPVKPEDLPSALTFAIERLPYIGGLMDTGWRFVLPDETVLADLARESHLHWWRGRRGLLATWEGDDDDGPVLGIGFAAVQEPDALADLLRDAVALTASHAVDALFWLAPADAAVQSALQQAGFATDEDSGVVFEKRHPRR